MKTRLNLNNFKLERLNIEEALLIEGGSWIGNFIGKVAGAVIHGIVEIAKSEPIRPSQYLHPDPNTIDLK